MAGLKHDISLFNDPTRQSSSEIEAATSLSTRPSIETYSCHAFQERPGIPEKSPVSDKRESEADYRLRIERRMTRVEATNYILIALLVATFIKEFL